MSGVIFGPLCYHLFFIICCYHNTEHAQLPATFCIRTCVWFVAPTPPIYTMPHHQGKDKYILYNQ